MSASSGRPRSSARGWGRALALAAGALALVASAAQAQGRTDSNRVGEIEYSAPRPCPDQAFFESRLRARVSRELPEALVSMRLRVTIEARASAVHGRIELVEASADAARAPSSSRQIEAASCREVVEGLALIAALAIAPPKARDSAATGEPAPTFAPATPTPTSPQRDLVRESPTAPITGAAASSAGQSERSDGVVAEGAPRAGAEAKSGDRDQAAPAEPDARAGPDSPAALSLYAGGLALHGLAPGLQAGLELGLELRVLHSDGLDWVVRVAGRFAFEQEFQASEGLAQFSFLGGAISLCAVGPVAAPRVSVDGCLVGEPGVLSAAGTATRNAEKYQRPWFAIGGGAGLVWQPWRAFGLRAGGELLLPIRRDSYRLGRELIHQVPAASVRLVLSLSLGLS